jgi:hypothetical protein
LVSEKINELSFQHAQDYQAFMDRVLLLARRALAFGPGAHTLI